MRIRFIVNIVTVAVVLLAVIPAHAGALLARACVPQLQGGSTGRASYDARAIAIALRGRDVSAVVPAKASSLPASRPVAPSTPFAREIDAVGWAVGVDVRLLRVVIAKESSGDPNAVSRDENGNPIAYGLMQVRPSTFEWLRPKVECLLGRRADIRRPLDNLTAGALLYRHHLDATRGNVEEAAKRYHGGLNPAQHGPRTRAYARGVAARYRLLIGPCKVPLDDWA
ncbi:MAG TPA: transglycosylase SLT domain-containing protein [Candidatus Binatus sp.]|nr:transglycosylase SLT domain-containing protein [Candidatus Binatus sp.]